MKDQDIVSKHRKTRSDKKTDVKPTLTVKTKRALYRFSELCELPVKDVIEQLCEGACTSPLILDDINGWFRRDYICEPTVYSGVMERPKLRLLYREETEVVNARFRQGAYDQLCDLAYSLDLPPTTTAAVLIKVTMKNRDFMFEYVGSLEHLSGEEKNAIHALLRRMWGVK